MNNQGMEKLPGKIRLVWVLSAGISLLGGLIGAGILWLVAIGSDWLRWIGPAALGIVIVVSVVQALVVPYRYHFSGYRITDTAVEIGSGWWVRKQVAIPIARVQNVTLEAGPLMQMNHLEQVVIATAADSHDIEGVTPEVARSLRDAIMARALEVRDNEL